MEFRGKKLQTLSMLCLLEYFDLWLEVQVTKYIA